MQEKVGNFDPVVLGAECKHADRATCQHPDLIDKMQAAHKAIGHLRDHCRSKQYGIYDLTWADMDDPLRSVGALMAMLVRQSATVNNQKKKVQSMIDEVRSKKQRVD